MIGEYFTKFSLETSKVSSRIHDLGDPVGFNSLFGMHMVKFCVFITISFVSVIFLFASILIYPLPSSLVGHVESCDPHLYAYQSFSQNNSQLIKFPPPLGIFFSIHIFFH